MNLMESLNVTVSSNVLLIYRDIKLVFREVVFYLQVTYQM